MASTYDRSAISLETASAIPKRIIICCDGTWQSATSLDPTKGCESNVTRLCRALAKTGTDRKEPEKVWQQVVFYDAGVGTGDISGFEQKRQGGLGIGLIENVIESYNFIVSNYSAGDQLFFFGFSRGAFTVRSAAGLVGQIGVLKPCYMPFFIKHYNSWINGKDAKGNSLAWSDRGKPFSAYPPWMEFMTENPRCAIKTAKEVPIQVMGVWDTVGSLGVPNLGHIWNYYKSNKEAYQFHDTELNDQILHAYQALALDETRAAFSPAIWKLKKTPFPEFGTEKVAAQQARQYLCQCWFPGAHVNVGGGNSGNADPNKATGDLEQLASISYAWMLDRIRPHLALDEDALDVQFKPFEELAQSASENTKTGTGWRIWDQAVAMKDYWTGTQKPVLTGYARGHIEDSNTLMYKIMASPQDRTPNRYHDQENEYSVERIHPSVYLRQKSKDVNGDAIYRPMALKGWVRIYKEDGMGRGGAKRKGWVWVKYKNNNTEKAEIENWLWEFQISKLPAGKSLEKRLMENSWVKPEQEKIQEGWSS
ncbi:peptidoglycan binding domain containing protein [Phlyctema vagabunda]|uniref:Peptidoglycan binding domain containing protein n=1 Tax=Phlyctema vagabunda TaxID=108571 RepID=A0ABR4PI57_9HELO